MEWLPSLLLLLCIGSSRSVSFRTNCPSEFKQYGDRSCFKMVNGSFSFQQGSSHCRKQHNGVLLTISTTLEYNRTAAYIKLYGNSESYWTGVMYRNNSDGESELTDADGNSVVDSMYDLESFNPTLGKCIAMKYSDERLMFAQEDCNKSCHVMCVTEWPAPARIKISSSPSGYGVMGQQVNLTCEVSPMTEQINVLWKFNGSHIDQNDGSATYTIDSFKPSHEGYYSCVATTKYWSISSIDLYVKTAVPPMISRKPMNATFYMGQQGFFECLPSNNSFPKPSVTWYKNGNLLNTDVQPLKYFLSPNTNTLLLSRVDDNDVGDYKCVLTNPAGNDNSHDQSHLNILSNMNNSTDDDIYHSGDDSMSVVGFLLRPQPLTVLVGDDATFDCVGEEGTMGYKWIAYGSDDTVINITSISIPEDHLFSSQTYVNVQLNEIHQVQCMLIVNETTISMPSEKVALEVVERAYVVNVSEDATVQYGTDFNLTCQFAGTPTPMVEWWFNSNPVDIGEYKTHDQVSVLTVKKFQPSRVGVYQCFVSNQYGADVGSVTLYGKDGQPDYVIASLLTVSKHQILVNWFTFNSPNSDTDLTQFEITWTDANNNSTMPQSRLLLFTDQEYSISDLNPFYYLNVTVATITPSICGSKIPLPLIYPFGNAPNDAPKDISIIRTDDNKALNISWSPITPDHSKGQGDMFGYEIEYRNKKVENATVMEHVYATWVYIEGLNSEGAYEVHVRCVVMVQSIPLPTEFERGPWSDWMASEGHVTAAPVRGSGNDKNLQVVIPVSVICVILIILVAGCVTYRMWRWVISRRRKREGNVTYSSMKNENAEEDEEL